MSLSGYKVVLFDLVVIEAFFGGITVGKLSGGRIFSGLKHSVSLMVIVLVVFGLVFLDPVAPHIDDINFSPLNPEVGNPVEVTTVLTDPFPGSGIQEAYLTYSTDGWASNRTVKMAFNRVKELWEAQIPPHHANTRVLFFIEAMDASLNVAVNDNAGGYFAYTVTG